MTVKKNHHFVPQFYFRRFSADKRSICVLQRRTGSTINMAPIKSQASKDWFYGTETIENALAVIEGKCSSVLRALDACRNPMLLDESEVELAVIWLALQRSRTESARKISKPMQDRLAQLHMEMRIANDDALDEKTKAEFRGFLDDVRADPVQSQLVGMTTAVESAGLLRDLTPILLTNRTNRPFVFGDSPVVFYNGLYRNVQLRGVLGLDTPGLIAVYPLSPELCLMLLDSACYKVKRVRENQIVIKELADVMALNKLQLHAATSCVYFNDFKLSGYMHELWRQERPHLTSKVHALVEVPGFSSETGEPIGDILHGFQPQLPFRLKLSFLQHEVLGDADYHFSCRSSR